MSRETVLNNVMMVTEEEVISGCLAMREGRITAMDNSGSSRAGGRDLNGDYLIPGLIELHTDNLERHLKPRPGVDWPSALSALMAHDAQIISAGITTVFDSIYIGYGASAYTDRSSLVKRSISALKESKARGFQRAEHLLHLRCEYAGRDILDQFTPFIDEPLLSLVSLMDHTPGQRQWTDLSKWRQYHSAKNWSKEEEAAVLKRLTASQAKYALKNRLRIAEVCREKGLPMASHDDTTPAHSEESAELGIKLSEFPTTMEAAARAKELGLYVIGGSPNLVRGESHSGNVSMRELARQGLLDVLSSDYVPVSLLHAVMILHQELDTPLPQAVAKVSANPARAAGLNDRGRLEPGLRADLAQVRMSRGVPVVMAVWREGERVF